MTLSSWLTYTIACILLIAPPGPTVTYLITTSMTHGRKTAYEIVWGSFWGGLICLFLSFLGIGALLKASSLLYTILRFLGIAYLFYLGLKSLWEARGQSASSDDILPPEKGEAFKNGFLLIFLNPKNIIFFASFIPQFINTQSHLLLQMLILGATYLIVGLINDYLYSFFASHIGQLLGKQSDKWLAILGGLAMIISALLVLYQNF